MDVRVPVSLTADDISKVGTEVLDRMFAAGGTPPPQSLEGFYRGAGLRYNTLRLLTPVGNAAIHRLTDIWLSAWQGKEFTPREDGSGEGINWFFPEFVRRRWLRFTVTEKAEQTGKGSVLLFDYDRKDNPPFTRGAYDEVREIASGLLLAKQFFKIGSRSILYSYFTLRKT